MSTTARLLFVDDEPRILEGIENMLFDRDTWEVRTATSGDEALRILAAEPPFDALITDMRMPIMDGLQLLQRVMRSHPHMIRIVLTGEAELPKAMQAITIAHQYLGKPCEESVLIKTIERALHIGRVIQDDELRRNLGAISEAPHDKNELQHIYRLASSDNASLSVIARAVANDVGLTAKIMQAASSAIFGGGSVSTVEAAVQRIGLVGVRALALALDVHSRISDENQKWVEQRQRQSLDIAALASSLATTKAEAERAYLCALLHDLGTITLMRHLPERMARCQGAWHRREGSMLDLERAEFGIDHAALGAEILGLFGMHDIADVVRYHHNPSRSGKPSQLDALGALHIAEATCNTASGSPMELDADFLDALGPIGESARLRAKRLARAA